MTVTILSLVCIVLATLCLCLWFYAANAAQDAAEAMWEAGYYEDQHTKLSKAYTNRLRDIEELKREVIELQLRNTP